MDLRCENKKHAVVLDGLVVQVKCGSRFCGAQAGVVVLHHFEALTGRLIKTATYKDADHERSGHAAGNIASVRPA